MPSHYMKFLPLDGTETIPSWDSTINDTQIPLLCKGEIRNRDTDKPLPGQNTIRYFYRRWDPDENHWVVGLLYGNDKIGPVPIYCMELMVELPNKFISMWVEFRPLLNDPLIDHIFYSQMKLTAYEAMFAVRNFEDIPINTYYQQFVK